MCRIATATATPVLAALLLLGGCGASTEPAAVSTIVTTGAAQSTPAADAGAAAPDAVARAYAALGTGPYVSRGVTTQEVDARGLDPSLRATVQRQLAVLATGITTTTRVASPERMAIAQRIGDRTQQVVLYDGQVFVSADGTRWARTTGAAAAGFPQASMVAQADPAALFTGLVATGAADVDGRTVTRYAGSVDTAATGALMQALLGGLGAPGSAIGDAVSLQSGTVAMLVDDATGTLARQEMSLRISLDVGALARGAGQDAAADLGSVDITSTGSETITDAGGSVTVTRPDATATVSTVAGLAQFLTS